MNLNRPVQKFAKTPVDGWNVSGWTNNIGKGAIEVYSRFITERTFGAVKRILLCAEPLPNEFTTIRIPDGTRYLLSYLDKDIAESTIYNYVYLLQEVSADARVITSSYSETASGMGGDETETPSVDIPCYLERYSGTASKAADSLVYSRVRFLLPRGTVVDTDDELEIGTKRYIINEVDNELSLVSAHVMEQ